MKYLTLLCDGMADRDDNHGLTPMDEAKKPTMDELCSRGLTGLVSTVPSGMKPGSDVCNLAALGYNPRECYTGRSPLEALSMGINLNDNDVSYRVNLVTLGGDGDLNELTMLDYSSGEISSDESAALIESLKSTFSPIELYAGISYRHAAVMRGGALGTEFTPPHDILGKNIAPYLPKGRYGEVFTEIINKSRAVLANHPINIARIKKGKNPATAVWPWGEGTKPILEPFEKKFGKKGAVISAVDLVKGIGKAGDMTVIDIPTATGTVDTDYAAKTAAAIAAFDKCDFVFLHFEGPDECGHQGDRKGKILSIERIDELVLKPLVQNLGARGDFRLAVMPDHATPLSVRTHTADPIPFFVYDSRRDLGSGVSFSEKCAATTGVKLERGADVINILFENN